MNIVPYEERFGEVKFPEGFEALLTGKSLEEQLEHYRIAETTGYTMTDWRERKTARYCRVDRCGDVRGLIVKDGLLVGVMICNEYGRLQACMPEEGVCTYDSDDNNGAGSKCRIDYAYLVCVP